MSDAAFIAFKHAEGIAKRVPTGRRRSSRGGKRLRTLGGERARGQRPTEFGFRAKTISIPIGSGASVSSLAPDEFDVALDCDPADLDPRTLSLGRGVIFNDAGRDLVVSVTPLGRKCVRGCRFARHRFLVQYWSERRGLIESAIGSNAGLRGPWFSLTAQSPTLPSAHLDVFRLACGINFSIEIHWSVVLRDSCLGLPIEIVSTPSGVRELMKLREGPRTPSGRRAAILHWVREHSRRSSSADDDIEVRGHLRGRRELEWAGGVVEVRPSIDLLLGGAQ